MNIAFYVIGVAVIFLVKLLVNNRNDTSIDGWKRVFEIPSDITMLAFMMGIAGTASLATYSREEQIIVLIIISMAIVSVFIYKENCRGLTEQGGIVQFDRPYYCILLFCINIGIAVSCAIMSYSYLGANES